jgi:Flp pilus assembly protein TadB
MDIIPAMTTEDGLNILKSYYSHAAAQRGTDNQFVVAIDEIIRRVEAGLNTTDAFDQVEQKIEEEKLRKAQQKANLQP